MKGKFIFIAAILFIALSEIYSQDSIFYRNEFINRIDSKNRRQGIWKTYNHGDSIYLECKFNEDTIVGTINIFKNGKLVFQILSPNCERKEFLAFYPKETIKGYFSIIDKRQAVIDMSGKEMNSEISEWIWKHSDIMPMFYGGDESFFAYIINNINSDNSKGRKGRVEVKYGIDRFGYVDIIGLNQKSHNDLNREAIRVVKSMPRWQPGFNRGLFVKTQFVIPIIFH